MAKEVEKTYFEQLQEQAEAAKKAAAERGPELGVGPQSFTILGGTHGEKDGREWSAVVARHTNGHEYRLFYNLYWPLKEGELEPKLNVDTFNWICDFDKTALASYKEANFDNYFNKLTGKSYEIRYKLSTKGKVVIDFSISPLLLDTLEEELVVDEIDFDAVE
jgi:hypothetical protein